MPPELYEDLLYEPAKEYYWCELEANITQIIQKIVINQFVTFYTKRSEACVYSIANQSNCQQKV